jgi:hypothetical protein
MRYPSASSKCILLLVFLASSPAAAQNLVIPAPSYTSANDIASLPITVDPYGWVHGIDTKGEWLEYDLELLVPGNYSSSITVKGTMGVAFDLELEFTGSVSQTAQTVQFGFTGSGFVG